MEVHALTYLKPVVYNRERVAAIEEMMDEKKCGTFENKNFKKQNHMFKISHIYVTIKR